MTTFIFLYIISVLALAGFVSWGVRGVRDDSYAYTDDNGNRIKFKDKCECEDAHHYDLRCPLSVFERMEDEERVFGPIPIKDPSVCHCQRDVLGTVKHSVTCVDYVYTWSNDRFKSTKEYLQEGDDIVGNLVGLLMA